MIKEFCLYLYHNQRNTDMKAALLLRCSTNLQDYNRQKNDLLAVAKRFGFTVSDDTIFGEYVTGKDDIRKGNRKSIQLLINACTDKQVDVVLISEVSRLSRNFIYGINTIDKFNRDYNIPIYFRDKKKWTIDIESGRIDTEFEKELRKYFEQAEAELDTLKNRFSSGRKDAAGLNQVIGSVASFGYKRVAKKNVLDDETAPIVKEMYDKYLEEGATLLKVSKYLIAKYPKFEKKLKAAGTLRKILVNKANTGVLTITIYDSIDEAGYKYDVIQPAIIDEDTYNRTIEKLKNNRTVTPYRNAAPHLLRKLIKDRKSVV